MSNDLIKREEVADAAFEILKMLTEAERHGKIDRTLFSLLYHDIGAIAFLPAVSHEMTARRSAEEIKEENRTYAEDFYEHFGHAWNSKENNWQCCEKLYNDNAECIDSPRCDCYACWCREMEAKNDH